MTTARRVRSPRPLSFELRRALAEIAAAGSLGAAILTIPVRHGDRDDLVRRGLAEYRGGGKGARKGPRRVRATAAGLAELEGRA